MRLAVHAVLAAALIACGCASHSTMGHSKVGQNQGAVQVPDPRDLSGENREWWDVYGVEYQGDRKIRERAGYLYRKWDSRNPRGFYWVLDRSQERIGFLLPDFQAYQIVRGQAQAVGTSDLNGGVKRILQVRGAVELEKTLGGSTAVPQTKPAVSGR